METRRGNRGAVFLPLLIVIAALGIGVGANRVATNADPSLLFAASTAATGQPTAPKGGAAKECGEAPTRNGKNSKGKRIPEWKNCIAKACDAGKKSPEVKTCPNTADSLCKQYCFEDLAKDGKITNCCTVTTAGACTRIDGKCTAERTKAAAGQPQIPKPPAGQPGGQGGQPPQMPPMPSPGGGAGSGSAAQPTAETLQKELDATKEKIEPLQNKLTDNTDGNGEPLTQAEKNLLENLKREQRDYEAAIKKLAADEELAKSLDAASKSTDALKNALDPKLAKNVSQLSPDGFLNEPEKKDTAAFDSEKQGTDSFGQPQKKEADTSNAEEKKGLQSYLETGKNIWNDLCKQYCFYPETFSFGTTPSVNTGDQEPLPSNEELLAISRAAPADIGRAVPITDGSWTGDGEPPIDEDHLRSIGTPAAETQLPRSDGGWAKWDEEPLPSNEELLALSRGGPTSESTTLSLPAKDLGDGKYWIGDSTYLEKTGDKITVVQYGGAEGQINVGVRSTYDASDGTVAEIIEEEQLRRSRYEFEKLEDPARAKVREEGAIIGMFAADLDDNTSYYIGDDLLIKREGDKLLVADMGDTGSGAAARPISFRSFDIGDKSVGEIIQEAQTGIRTTSGEPPTEAETGYKPPDSKWDVYETGRGFSPEEDAEYDRIVEKASKGFSPVTNEELDKVTAMAEEHASRACVENPALCDVYKKWVTDARAEQSRRAEIEADQKLREVQSRMREIENDPEGATPEKIKEHQLLAREEREHLAAKEDADKRLREIDKKPEPVERTPLPRPAPLPKTNGDWAQCPDCHNPTPGEIDKIVDDAKKKREAAAPVPPPDPRGPRTRDDDPSPGPSGLPSGMPSMPEIPKGSGSGGGGPQSGQGNDCSLITSLISGCPKASCTINASPTTLQPQAQNVQQPVRLSWEGKNADQATLTILGPVPVRGWETVYPQTTTTYTLRVWGDKGEAECRTTVTLQSQSAQAPYGTGTNGQPCAQPPAQPPSTSCTVGAWKPEYANSCLSNWKCDSNANCPAQPAQPTSACSAGAWNPTYASGTSCINGWQCGGTPQTPTQTPAGTEPQAKITCDRETADSGMPLAITWECTNSTSSSGSGFATDGKLTGNASVKIAKPPSGANTASYSVGCTGQGKSASAQCTVKVASPSIILVANPKKVQAGTASTIGWVTSGMKACTITSPDLADFNAENADETETTTAVETPALTKNTDFVLNCTTAGGGTKIGTTTVMVEGEVPQGAIDVTSSIDGKTNVSHGNTVTITWSASTTKSNAAISLWIYDNRFGQSTALIARGKELSGTYEWKIPEIGSACAADEPFACASDLVGGRSYAIEAALYTPQNAYLGGTRPQGAVDPTYHDFGFGEDFTVAP